MSGNSGKKLGANAQKKLNFWLPIQKSIDAKQASIDSCYARKEEKRKLRAKLLQELEKLRIQRLYNLKKRMVVIFVVLNGQIVILTMVDPSLMSCTYSSAKNHHIVYGNTEYHRLSMMASHNPRGTRTDKLKFESYTVSTVDGTNFDVIDKNGKVLSFETFMKYESLDGQTVSDVKVKQTFLDVKVDQWLYDPSDVESDEKTRMIHAELLKVIEEDKKYLAENPTLLEEGYVLYHWSAFA
jgi:hypothetical protein